MNQLGRADAYEDIDYDDLDPNDQALVDELNLEDLLRQQLARDDIDVGIMKFILRRLAQLDDKDVVDELLGEIDHCYPVVSHLVEYLLNLESLEEPEKHEIGSKLIEAVRSGLVGHLPYHRAWLLHVFASDADWDNKKEFVRLWGTLSQDGLSQRKLILALGRSRQAFWFRARKKDVFDLGPWQRRAFLVGASCLPTDEGNHWYKSMQTKLDPLEATVVKWVRNHPF